MAAYRHVRRQEVETINAQSFATAQFASDLIALMPHLIPGLKSFPQAGDRYLPFKTAASESRLPLTRAEADLLLRLIERGKILPRFVDVLVKSGDYEFLVKLTA